MNNSIQITSYSPNANCTTCGDFGFVWATEYGAPFFPIVKPCEDCDCYEYIVKEMQAETGATNER